MNVMLSGGDLGGDQVEWPEGQTHVNLYGFIYELCGESAVFVGLAQG